MAWRLRPCTARKSGLTGTWMGSFKVDLLNGLRNHAWTTLENKVRMLVGLALMTLRPFGRERMSCYNLLAAETNWFPRLSSPSSSIYILNKPFLSIDFNLERIRLCTKITRNKRKCCIKKSARHRYFGRRRRRWHNSEHGIFRLRRRRRRGLCTHDDDDMTKKHKAKIC